MNPPDELKEALAAGRTLRIVGEDIYSALPEGPREHLYDRRARAYDLVVSTHVYNRLMWGASPRDYIDFARSAISSHASGPLLDAACGSMLFSASAHVESRRVVVAFDQSLRMLERARARLIKLAGRVPTHITLLQADLGDLPFRPRSFQTVLCMNALHQFEDADVLIPKLESLLDEGGRMFLTSLVKNGRLVGDRYLDALHRAGEFVKPRGVEEVKKLFNRLDGHETSFRVRGNMMYAVTGALK